MTITLSGRDLTVTQVAAVGRHGETVALAPRARCLPTWKPLVELVTGGTLTPAA